MEEITSNMIFKQRGGGIMSKHDIEFLQDMSVARDEANNGMTRLEIINLIKELTGVNEQKKAENCWDYLVKKGKMKYLKSGGRVKKAQSTMTKRTAIPVEQQLIWHSTIDSGIEELVRLDEPRDEFKY